MARAPSMILLTGLTVLSLALLFTALEQAQGASSSGGGKRQEQAAYVPVRRVVYRSRLPASASAAAAEDAAVGYEPFELCDGCRCCSTSDPSSCVDTSCCYAIDCNLPGKPFGTCAFAPQTCGCGDSNCTQPS
ncbi:hypothetical protein BS78_05G020200 [Paspalum vaginatum]|nr:hypothetical protein BS78_05G020200 [Paspalum vaginatum]KAJ1273899.1 hypothetical protein BS78_05G020200 [Paspalum vaginatum]